jgi:hypothetical protein
MTYQELSDQVFAAPPHEREAVAERLLEQYTEDDKELVEMYIFEAIVAADDTQVVYLL